MGNLSFFIKKQKQPQVVFCKKGVLRDFLKFTGKHLCQSLLFNKVAGMTLYSKRETGTRVFLCIFQNF